MSKELAWTRREMRRIQEELAYAKAGLMPWRTFKAGRKARRLAAGINLTRWRHLVDEVKGEDERMGREAA